MQGGSVENLAAVVGHSSAELTRRYGHLPPDLFPERDYGLLTVDLRQEPGEVVEMPDAESVGRRLARQGGTTGAAAVQSSVVTHA